MSEGYVQVPTDASGKKLRTIERIVGPNTVQEEVIEIARASDGVTIDLPEKSQFPATLTAGGGLKTEDTGLNTNPERWLHIYHWEQREVTLTDTGAPGAQNLGGAVGGGLKRRIRSLKIRHAGTSNTVVTLFADAIVVDSWDIPAQTTRVVSDEDGWAFAAAEQPSIQTSDVTGGSTYVSARGVEAAI